MEEIIKVEGLTKCYNDVKAVNNISFSVKQGELLGFLGENGAGKSTTINMLCTLLKMDQGKVNVCGLELGKDNQEIARTIGVVFQNNTLDDLLTVKENLMTRGILYAKIDEVRKQVKWVSELLEIKDLLPVRYKKLSGGQKRRVEIARALLHVPKVLFLDEPTTGLDPQTRNIVWNLINRLRSELNMTVFLTTHYMEEAAMADHIIILDKGEIIEDSTPVELKERYAHDRLLVVPKDKEMVKKIASHKTYHVYEQQQQLIIPIEESKKCIPLLKELEKYIESFEVIKGTMDDVFLEVTKNIEQNRKAC